MPFATAIEIGCHVFLRTCHPSAGGRDVWSVLTRHAWTVFGRRLKGRTKHALKEDFLVLRSCVFALSKPASGSLERLCTSVRSGRCLPTSPFSPYSFCLSSLKSVFSPSPSEESSLLSSLSQKRCLLSSLFFRERVKRYAILAPGRDSLGRGQKKTG